MKSFKFDPAEVTVKVGTTVTWRNEDATAGGYQSPLIWIETQTPGGDDIAIAIDGAGKNPASGAEVIANESTAPTGESFTAPANKAAGLALPSAPYAQNDRVGVWVKRHVPASTVAYNANSFVLKVEGDSNA